MLSGKSSSFRQTKSRCICFVKQFAAASFLALIACTSNAATGDLIFANQIGGTQDCYMAACEVDSSNSCIMTGYFHGTIDFDAGPAVTNLTSNVNGQDMFVIKVDQAGNLQWAKQFGGPNADTRGLAIAVDASSIFVSGMFVGTVDFDPGPGTTNATVPAMNPFAMKLTVNGDLDWVRHTTGGTNYSSGMSNGVDSSGNVYTTGTFSGTIDFDPSAAIFNLPYGDGFVWKLDTSGNFAWATNVGFSTSLLFCADMRVSPGGECVVAGDFSGTGDWDPGVGTTILTNAGALDAFICKFASDGSLLWAKRIGGTTLDAGTMAGTSSDGAVYLAGYAEGPVDFDPGPGVFMLGASSHIRRSFVAKLSANGDFIWAREPETGSTSHVVGTVTSDGVVVLGGLVYGATDFDFGAGTTTLESGRNFIWILDNDGNHRSVCAFGEPSTTYDFNLERISLTVDSNQNLWYGGVFIGTPDFDAGPGVWPFTGHSSPNDDYYDGYLVKLSGPVLTPSVRSFARSGPETTNVSRVEYTVTFTDAVSGVDASDFEIVANGVAGASVQGVTGSGKTYTISIDTGTGDGAISMRVIDNDSIVYGTLAPLGGSGISNGTFQSPDQTIIDKTAPYPVLTSTASSITNMSPIHVEVTLTESVIGFSATDIDATNATVSGFSGSGDSYAFDLVPIAQGIVTAGVAPAKCADQAGNANSASPSFTREYDLVHPTVTISSAVTGPTRTAPIPLTITFSKAVSGFEATDIVIGCATATNFTSLGAATYTIDLAPDQSGLVTASVPVGAALSLAGNQSQAATYAIVYDNQPPTISLLGDNPVTIIVGTTYFDAGATAFDTIDGDRSGAIVVNVGEVDTSVSGNYIVTYDVNDTAGNAASQVTRNVIVRDEDPPVPVSPWFMIIAIIIAAALISRERLRRAPG